MPTPGVFSAINTRIQSDLVGKDLSSLGKDLPEGEIVNQEGWVDSKVVPGTSVFIKGKVEIISKRFHLLKLIANGQSLFIKGTSPPVNSQPACFIADNKFLTKNILRSYKTPTPKS